MQDRKSYEYAVIRLVPRVEREEFLNVGVVLYSPQLRFLGVRFHLDSARLAGFLGKVDIADVECHLEAFERICKGECGAGPIGMLPLGERFRWLSATRSTVLQMSKVHIGLTCDPEATLNELFERLVL